MRKFNHWNLPRICCWILISISTSCVQFSTDVDPGNSPGYDIVEFNVLGGKHKRSPPGENAAKTDLEILFKSLDTDFHLLLQRDSSFSKIPVEAGSTHKLGQPTSVKADFYEGVLKNYPLESRIFCFLSNSSLTAFIETPIVTYFVEPAQTFLRNASEDPRKIAVYTSSSIQMGYLTEDDHSKESYLDDMQFNYDVASDSPAERRGINISATKEDLFCEIEVVADHTLYERFDRSVDRVAATLYLHAKMADQVFRDADFGITAGPGRLRIKVGKIFVYKSEKDKNYPMSGTDIPGAAANISSYLGAFTLREQGSRFCLSVAMAYRPFPDRTWGLAYVAIPSANASGRGGICDRPLPWNEATGRYKKRYLNTGVVNLLRRGGDDLPLQASLYAFAHEVAHGFGSGHDGPNCSSEQFLMSPAFHGSSANMLRMSPCSRRDISEALLLVGGCLKPEKAECGNGVREGGEACDCGPRATCREVDPCCTASCTLLDKCSPREQSCCKNCSAVHPAGTVCHRDDHLCSVSFCNGSSAACPAQERLPSVFCSPKKSVCAPNSTTCDEVCTPRGLQDCRCNHSALTQCFRCCLRNNVCIPAFELGLRAADSRPFVLEKGSACGKGICDGRGSCVRDSRSLDLSLKIILTSFLVGISFLLAVAIFFWHRSKVTRPNREMSLNLLE